MLDNNLSWDAPIPFGKLLTISCPPGVWSSVFGSWQGASYSGMSAAPVVSICAPGSYAVAFDVAPSVWFDPAARARVSNWVGRVTMTCSDGVVLEVDAQPDFNSGGLPPGVPCWRTGFCGWGRLP